MSSSQPGLVFPEGTLAAAEDPGGAPGLLACPLPLVSAWNSPYFLWRLGAGCLFQRGMERGDSVGHQEVNEVIEDKGESALVAKESL